MDGIGYADYCTGIIRDFSVDKIQHKKIRGKESPGSAGTGTPAAGGIIYSIKNGSMHDL